MMNECLKWMNEMFAAYFSSVYEPHDPQAYDIPDQFRDISSPGDNFSTLTLSQNSVFRKLQTFNVTKTVGFDDLPFFFVTVQ